MTSMTSTVQLSGGDLGGEFVEWVSDENGEMVVERDGRRYRYRFVDGDAARTDDDHAVFVREEK